MIEIWKDKTKGLNFLSLNLSILCLSTAVIYTLANTSWLLWEKMVYFFLRDTIPSFLYFMSQSRQNPSDRVKIPTLPNMVSQTCFMV